MARDRLTRSTLRVAAVVVAASAAYVAAAHLASEWRHRIERDRERTQIELCMENVRGLLARLAVLAERAPYEKSTVMQWSGSGHLFDRFVQHRFPDSYWIGLRCPADPGDELEDDIARFMDDAKRMQFFPTGSPVSDAAGLRRIGAYAARDFGNFPMSVDVPDDETWIICDRCGDDGRTLHHPGGLVVGFQDGSVRFVTIEELGLDGPEDVVIGPESSHPEMRAMATVIPPKK